MKDKPRGPENPEKIVHVGKKNPFLKKKKKQFSFLKLPATQLRVCGNHLLLCTSLLAPSFEVVRFEDKKETGKSVESV